LGTVKLPIPPGVAAVSSLALRIAMRCLPTP